MSEFPDFPPVGVTKHTELTDKEVAGVIDHADASVTDAKLASGVGLSDGQICKLPTAVEDKILKRGAAAWEAGDVPPPVLEGDYSTYTLKQSKQDTDMSLSMALYKAFAVFNSEETKAIFVEPDNLAKTYDVATNALSSSLFKPGAYGEAFFAPSVKSAYETYVVFLSYNFVEAYICKNGALLQTVKNTDLGLPASYYFKGASISPKGKYVVLYVEDNRTWYILEGS